MKTIVHNCQNILKNWDYKDKNSQNIKKSMKKPK